VIIAVAGSKADLPHEGFDLTAAEDQCEQLGVPFHLTSAETGEVKGGGVVVVLCTASGIKVASAYMQHTQAGCMVCADSGGRYLQS